MPVLFRNQEITSVSVCVWHITETEDFFSRSLLLTEADRQQILQCKLPSRRLERFACRAALAHLLGSNEVAITYTPQGQPALPGYHLSFSHCRTHVAVALSPRCPVGIDIERVQDRITQLFPKFLSAEECAALEVTSKQQLHRYWGAKEAMYKCCGGNITSYTNHIALVPIPAHGVWQGEVHKLDRCYHLNLYHWTLDDLCLVVAVDHHH